MVYRRKGRPSLYFEARTRTGHQQMCTWTPDKILGQRIEHMWDVLATRHRAWDLLEPVLGNSRLIGRLYDLWDSSRHNVDIMRQAMADVDLLPVVTDWAGVYVTRVKPDTAAHAEVHVRWLIPGTVMTSGVSAEWLTDRLAAYPGKRNTLRKVHSAWTTFFDYAVSRKLFPANPMNHVERPKRERPPIRFYEIDAVQQIVEWQPTEQRRALMALLYGTSMDVSAALVPGLTRADFNPATKEVRGAGTKAHTRDRTLRIADWAWPTLWAYIKSMTPQVKLFDGVSRSGASFWHRQTVKNGIWEATGRTTGGRGGDAKLVKAALDLGASYPLRYARHHWAVRALRAGTPIAVVQRQLGHSSPLVTLDVYGQFLPDAADRAKWEQAATDYDTNKREAK